MRARQNVTGLSIAFALAACGPAPLHAQDYPSKPIRMVTGSPGSSIEALARLLSPGLAAGLGQPVVVDPRGSALLIGAAVAKAPPDGYTLLIIGSNFWVGPLLRDNAPYDPAKDFSTITLVGQSPFLLVVHPSLPAKSTKDVIALARAKPGALNYSSGISGSSTHLAGALFTSMAGVNILRVPYRTGALEIADLVGGQVQLTFGSPASVSPHVKSGKLRALAVTVAEPTSLFPSLPTVAASGLPGYQSGTAYGVWAPANTPAVLIDRLNQAIVRVLKTPDVTEKFFNAGVEIVASSPQQLDAAIKSEMARLGKVIKEAGIREE